MNSFLRYQSLIAALIFSTGCPVAHSYDQPELPKCVIDSCEDKICVVETPEGWVEVPKREGYQEGKLVECPLWLIEPT